MKVGDLDPETTIYRSVRGKIAHLDTDCFGLSEARKLRRREAREEFNDREVCKYCTGDVSRQKRTTLQPDHVISALTPNGKNSLILTIPQHFWQTLDVDRQDPPSVNIYFSEDDRKAVVEFPPR